MSHFNLLLLLTLTIFTTSCGNQNSTPDAPAAGEATPAPASKTHVQITLRGYTCGDNCYLKYTENEADTTPKTAICLSAACGAWEAAGQLPADLKGRVAYAAFATARQYDAAGNVMDDNYPAITELKLVAEKAQPTPVKSGDGLAANIQHLQGTWKRQSYPYGTIEFEQDQVKFNVGEGSAELPTFQPFTLKSDCPSSGSDLPTSTYDFGLVTDGGECNAIKLNGNRFEIYFPGSKEGVSYQKQ